MSWLLSIFGFAAGNWQRLAIYGLLIAGAAAACAGWGYMKGVERLYTYQADQARQAVKIVVKQGEATERVVVRYVKVRGATQVITQTVERRSYAMWTRTLAAASIIVGGCCTTPPPQIPFPRPPAPLMEPAERPRPLKPSKPSPTPTQPATERRIG